MSKRPEGWIPRIPLLKPIAIAGIGPVAVALIEAARHRPDLLGRGSERAIVLFGPNLPSIDGVISLGRDPRAPLLLLPIQWLPVVPLNLFEAALRKKCPTTQGPVAVLPPQHIIPLWPDDLL